MFNLINSKKGITLISLVITIIVLLILAGVSIATLTGENGLLERSTQAVTENKKAEAKEASAKETTTKKTTTKKAAEKKEV